MGEEQASIDGVIKNIENLVTKKYPNLLRIKFLISLHLKAAAIFETKLINMRICSSENY